jgi:hypothetical protein
MLKVFISQLMFAEVFWAVYRVVHRTCDRNQLVECAGLPEVLKPLNAGVHDGPVALRREGHATAEPFLVPELKDLLKRVPPDISLIGIWIYACVSLKKCVISLFVIN